MCRDNKWNWRNGTFAGLFFLNLIILTFYLFSIPDSHFSDLQKKVGVIGGWVVAIATYLGINKWKIRGTPSQVFNSKPIRICIIILTVFCSLLFVPIHSIEIHSNPEGAAIYIDNEKGSRGDADTSPKIKGLYARAYNIRLEKAGYEDCTRTVSFIEVIMHEEISVNLKQQTGTLHIESTPNGADIYINDEKQSRGTTPASLHLPVDTYKLTLKKNNWDIKTVEVKIKPNQTMREDIQMLQVNQKLFKITIISEPPGAEIWVNGIFRGCTSSIGQDIELAKGSHDIILKKDNIEKKETVKIPTQDTIFIDMN